MQDLSIDKQLTIFIKEALNKSSYISFAILIITSISITVGFFWPKVYESSASILWSQGDAINPLLRGEVARTTTVRDQVDIAKEIILSNKILNLVVEKAGIDTSAQGDALNTRDIALIKGGLRNSIRINNRGPKIIQISYLNSNPEMAYLIVSLVSEMFLKESRETRNKSSKDAFDFINSQVIEYKVKLDSIKKNVIDFKKENVDLDSDTSRGVSTRVNSLKASIRQSKLGLTEARVRNSALEDQLTAEIVKLENQYRSSTELESSQGKEQILIGRITILRENLDIKLLEYTDNHPDVIQIERQIKGLEEKLITLRTESNIEKKQKSNTTTQFVPSALYIQLSQDIADVETLIKTLRARTLDNQSRLDSELLRSNNVNSLESQLTDMSRELTVTQQIHDDLLTRRENARVSLNLQMENQGSSFKIQEPPVIPQVPVGLRFLHFLVGSVALGVAIPLGLLFAFLILDSRIRHEDNVYDELDIPVVGVIAHYATDGDRSRSRHKALVTISFLGIATIYLVVVCSIKLFY